MKAGATLDPRALPVARARLADYLELTKPRVGLLVLFTVAAGYWLAEPAANSARLSHALLGTALIIAGASTLNQVLERRTDALMGRTENRPLPSGRVHLAEATIFGALLAALGIAYLAVWTTPVAAAVAAVALVSYVFVYTPLKRRTSLNTLVGAVPGALPPLIGWAAAGSPLNGPAWTLFSIVFLWQVPHFLAIAWIYRQDYRAAGLQMLPVIDERGRLTAKQMVGYCVALVAVSLAPGAFGLAGAWYIAGALLLGLAFLYTIICFTKDVSDESARRVLSASLVYLPSLLVLLLADGALERWAWLAGG
jgi:protoheme IX farnesyltransferase